MTGIAKVTQRHISYGTRMDKDCRQIAARMRSIVLIAHNPQVINPNKSWRCPTSRGTAPLGEQCEATPRVDHKRDGQVITFRANPSQKCSHLRIKSSIADTKVQDAQSAN